MSRKKENVNTTICGLEAGHFAGTLTSMMLPPLEASPMGAMMGLSWLVCTRTSLQKGSDLAILTSRVYA